MTLRLATAADLPRIVEIYNATIASRRATADLEPVTVDERRPWFEAHDPSSRPLYVREREGRVVAWVSFESFYGRSAYRHTAEVSVYVDGEYRARGLGRTLLTDALRKAPALGIRTLVGYVFAHNEPSLRLLRSLGFSEWGRLPDIAEMDGEEYSLCILGKRLTDPSSRA